MQASLTAAGWLLLPAGYIPRIVTTVLLSCMHVTYLLGTQSPALCVRCCLVCCKQQYSVSPEHMHPAACTACIDDDSKVPAHRPLQVQIQINTF
jgi:hypothetical protein